MLTAASVPDAKPMTGPAVTSNSWQRSWPARPPIRVDKKILSQRKFGILVPGRGSSSAGTHLPRRRRKHVMRATARKAETMAARRVLWVSAATAPPAPVRLFTGVFSSSALHPHLDPTERRDACPSGLGFTKKSLARRDDAQASATERATCYRAGPSRVRPRSRQDRASLALR